MGNKKKRKEEETSIKGEIGSKAKFMERDYKKRWGCIAFSMRKKNYFEKFRNKFF